jgi:hypothetical protein
MKRGWRKGMVLVQTLIISVILSMIAVMVMKWVLARYMLAARNYRASESASHSQWVAGEQFSRWNFNTYPNSASIPSSGSQNIDGANVSFIRTGPQVNITVTQD